MRQVDPMEFSYGWQKLCSAAQSLCSLGSQAERLVSAVTFSPINITPDNDLPEVIREDFDICRRAKR